MPTPPPPLPSVPYRPEPVAYAAPGTNPTARPDLPGRVVGGTVWSLIVAAMVHVALTSVVRKFDAIFSDFKLDVPNITRALIHFGRWYRQSHGWLILPPLLLALGIGAALLLPPRRRRGMPLVFVLILGLFIAWLVIGLFVPMSQLMSGISSGTKSP